MEMRRHTRYRLGAVVDFEWEGSDGVLHTGTGYTRDISGAGVFILCQELLPIGISVELVVNLPSLQDGSSGAQMRTQGHVVRIEGNGFVVIADMGFRMKFSESQAVPNKLFTVLDSN